MFETHFREEHEELRGEEGKREVEVGGGERERKREREKERKREGVYNTDFFF